MKSILIDTNAYVAFKRGQQSAVEILQLASQIAVSTVVLGELLAGFSGGSQEAKNRLELAHFLDSPRVSSLPITQQTAEHFAKIYQGLRRKGRPIPSNDLWIAATALEHGLALFTYDRHFDVIENLSLGDSPEQFLP